MKSIPIEFRERMKEYLKEDYPRFETSLEEDPVRAFHTNLVKIQDEQLQNFFEGQIRDIGALPGCHYFLGEEKAGKMPLHHAGAMYMQEPAAMLPVFCFSIQPGMRVLDACAAPGGKSSQLLNALGNIGLLVSNEYTPSRVSVLASNLERLGSRISVVTNTSLDCLADWFPAYFDAVLVDAPCSGEGMFRKEQAAIDDWSLSNVELCAKRQKELLEEVSKALRPGGELVYSTCTFSLEENENLILEFLESHKDFHLKALPQKVLDLTQPPLLEGALLSMYEMCMRRAYPHTGPGEGQFMALLERDDGEVQNPVFVKKGKKGVSLREKIPQGMLDAWKTFVDENMQDAKLFEEPVFFKDALCLLPEGTVVPRQDDWTYSFGVRLGTADKNRWIPEQWLFSAYGTYFKRQIELSKDDPLLEQYLKGETIPTTLDAGWGVVLCEGCPVGGVKISGGQAKNHYPKGLRLFRN